MTDYNVKQILTETTQALQNEDFDPNDLSLEALIVLINSERLKGLQEKAAPEFSELKSRQEVVVKLHKILKAINAATDSESKLDATNNEELKNYLLEAKDLGVDIADGKTAFNLEERDRLVENIRMTVEDLNVQNDMQLQTISRLTNERNESYQIARSILRPLHESKSSIAKSLRGA